MATFFNGGIGSVPFKRYVESECEYKAEREKRERERKRETETIKPKFSALSRDAEGLARSIWEGGEFEGEKWLALNDALEESSDDRAWWVNLYRQMLDMTDPKSKTPNPEDIAPRPQPGQPATIGIGVFDYGVRNAVKAVAEWWADHTDQFNALVECIVGLDLYQRPAGVETQTLFRWCLFRGLRLIQESAKDYVVRLGQRAGLAVMPKWRQEANNRRREILKEFGARLIGRQVLEALKEPDRYHAMPNISTLTTGAIAGVRNVVPMFSTDELRDVIEGKADAGAVARELQLYQARHQDELEGVADENVDGDEYC